MKLLFFNFLLMKITDEMLKRSLNLDSSEKNYEKTLIKAIALQMHRLPSYVLTQKIRQAETLIGRYRRNKGYYSNVKNCKVHRSITSNKSVLL